MHVHIHTHAGIHASRYKHLFMHTARKVTYCTYTCTTHLHVLSDGGEYEA